MFLTAEYTEKSTLVYFFQTNVVFIVKNISKKCKNSTNLYVNKVYGFAALCWNGIPPGRFDNSANQPTVL